MTDDVDSRANGQGDRERSASGKATAKEETRTKAELAYEAHYKRAREAQMIKEMASKSHKDKVREFNEKLSKLSEHHDTPRITRSESPRASSLRLVLVLVLVVDVDDIYVYVTVVHAHEIHRAFARRARSVREALARRHG